MDLTSRRLSSRVLPLFLTEENRILTGLLLFGSTAFLYVATNHYQLMPPQFLPMTWVDYAIPFLPQTVWLYISEYFFFAMIYLSVKDLALLNRYFYSLFSLQTLSVLIFLIWPTTYPRDLFPLPESLDKMTYLAFSSLRQTDTPANCCPSLHVSATLLTALLYRDDQQNKNSWKMRGVWIWASLICASTLTTKQHYLADLLAGAALSVVVFWFFHRIIPYPGAEPKKQITQNVRQ